MNTKYSQRVERTRTVRRTDVVGRSQVVIEHDTCSTVVTMYLRAKLIPVLSRVETLCCSYIHHQDDDKNDDVDDMLRTLKNRSIQIGVTDLFFRHF